MSRVVRFLLAAAALVAALILAAVVALFTLINQEAAQKTLERLTHSAFGTQLVLSGPLEIHRFPALTVTVPEASFLDPDTQQEKARWQGAHFRLSLWSLPLGAINVVEGSIAGLKTSLATAEPTVDSLMRTTAGSFTLPDNLRLKNFTFSDATLTLAAGSETREFSQVNLKLDALSPEMTTTFDVTASVATSLGVPEPPSPAASVENAASETPAPAGQPTEPPVQPPAAPAAGEAAEPPTESAPAPVENTPAAPAEPPVSGAFLSRFLITPAYAADTLPPVAAPDSTEFARLMEAWLAATREGTATFSAAGTLSVSSTDRTVSFEKLKFSADALHHERHYTLVAAADYLAFSPDAISGTNVNASLSEPEKTAGDLLIGAVDFRLTGTRLQSPEMRLAYNETEGGRTASYETSASVDGDIAQRTAHFENLSARILVTGDDALPQDFEAQLSGFLNADFKTNTAQAGLAGNFAGTPFSFNGHLAYHDRLSATGELMVSAVDLLAMPHFKSLAWMKAADFTGDLRIGQITAGRFTALQAHSHLSVKDGATQFTDVIVNVADGRILGKASLANDAQWNFSGRLDGFNLEKLFTSFGGNPVLSGIANGAFEASGTGLDPATMRAEGSVRLLRGAYKGLNARAVRDFVAGRGREEVITQPGAWTEIDEAAGDLTLQDKTLSVRRFVSRSVYQRTQADFTLSLEANTISGKAQTLFAPTGGIPSIRLSAEISGQAGSPAWRFDYEEARKQLLRAQGRPLVKEHRSEGRGGLWQSVKDFFRF